ncbi:complement C1q tumor necrosis factor-related protein 4-like [Branchiostoma floridae]|nr:complement C1q tumor necrosis factor-related protein 4-like [Branchiostoma floridae]
MQLPCVLREMSAGAMFSLAVVCLSLSAEAFSLPSSWKPRCPPGAVCEDGGLVAGKPGGYKPGKAPVHRRPPTSYGNTESRHHSNHINNNNNILPVSGGSQVAFSAKRTTDFTAPWERVIEFDRLLSNVGSSFDPYFGVFTCRVAGTYFFTFNMKKMDARRTAVHLMKNRRIEATAEDDSTRDTSMLSQAVVLHLEVGDTVYTKLASGGLLDGSGEDGTITFTGFLLYQD